MSEFRIAWPACALAVTLLAAAPALAKTGSSTFQITANVPSSCSIAATDLAFGNIPPNIATAIDATSSLNVLCTLDTAYSVALDAGTSPGATVAARKMLNGSNTLAYALYSDSTRTTVWGDGTASSSALTGTGSGVSQTLTVYGRIPANQTDIAAGSFTDTITATITY